MTAPTTIAWRRPCERRVTLHIPGGDYVEGFDGAGWEYIGARDEYFRNEGAAAAAARRGAEFDESFVDSASKGHVVEAVGSRTLFDRDVDQLRVILRDGRAKDYYFDRGTALILAVGKSMPLHARGSAVSSLTVY